MHWICCIHWLIRGVIAPDNTNGNIFGASTLLVLLGWACESLELRDEQKMVAPFFCIYGSLLFLLKNASAEGNRGGYV